MNQILWELVGWLIDWLIAKSIDVPNGKTKYTMPSSGARKKYEMLSQRQLRNMNVSKQLIKKQKTTNKQSQQ